ncbi:MAG: hypothetical protein K2X81_12075 [Candidatus Obscuribacterales bacterium]|nr:hypothetical protein [Candidatus Obscuribacterales bacterium]
MKGIRQLILASLLVLGPVQMAQADLFNDDNSGDFHSHLNDFGKSLDNVGQQMRNDFDTSTMQQAQRYFTDQQNVQSGTQATAQESFMNGQMQATNGGASGYSNNFGNNGLFGGNAAFGISGFGIGSPATTVGGAQTQPNNFNTSGDIDLGTAYQSGYTAGLNHASNSAHFDAMSSLRSPKTNFSIPRAKSTSPTSNSSDSKKL